MRLLSMLVMRGFAAEGEIEGSRMEVEDMGFSEGRMLHAEAISDVQGTRKTPVQLEQNIR